MSIDLFSGEVNDEPVFIPEHDIHTPLLICDLAPGEHGYASTNELWVPPTSNVAYIDKEGEVFTLDQLADFDEDELDYVRVIAFQNTYAVDIHHIIEYYASRPREKFKIRRLLPYDYEELDEDFAAIGGLIRIREQLNLFNKLLLNTYGEQSVLPPIEVKESSKDTTPADE